jgi:hypothetical protein
MATSTSPAVPPASSSADAAQQVYAHWLGIGSRLGLAVLVVSFVAYVGGWIAPLVPLDTLPQLWNQPVAAYLRATGQPTGWGWLAHAHRGDVMNLVGIALLGTCSLPCLLRVAPIYARARDRAFVLLCLLESVVLILAASGIIGGGH